MIVPEEYEDTMGYSRAGVGSSDTMRRTSGEEGKPDILRSCRARGEDLRFVAWERRLSVDLLTFKSSEKQSVIDQQ